MTNPADLVAKMLDARETLRRFWGAEYETKIEPARAVIHGIRAAVNLEILPATLMVARFFQARGEDFNVLATIAAAADLCDAERYARAPASCAHPPCSEV